MAQQRKRRPGPKPSGRKSTTAPAGRKPAPDKDALRAERAQRVAAREAAKAKAAGRQKRQKVLRVGVVVLVIAGIVGYFLTREVLSRREISRLVAASADAASAAGCSDIDKPSNAGREHIARGDVADGYTSEPPTSGPHYTTTAGEGVRETAVEEQLLIHNLEHGGVVVHHKGLPADQLAALTERIGDDDGKVLLVPDDKLERDGVAYTAWRRLQTCERYDADVLDTFLELYLDPDAADSSAPEKGRSI